jgi:hypothetical protein
VRCTSRLLAGSPNYEMHPFRDPSSERMGRIGWIQGCGRDVVLCQVDDDGNRMDGIYFARRHGA